MKVTRVTLLNVASLAIVLALLAFWLAAAASRYHGTDVITYLAAGERLNAGHQLYALVAGDREVVIDTRHFAAPLLYPPLIAVLWRPLALLPEQLSTGLFLAVNAVALAAVVAYLLRSMRPAAMLAVAAFSIGIAVTVVQGNVNGLLTAGCLVVWRYRDRPWAGALVALMSGIKLYPAVLAIWLFGQRRWLTLAWFCLAGVVVLAVSIVGAGLDANLRYVDIARTAQVSDQSISALTGLPWACFALDIVGSIAVWLSRSRPAWSFRIAVLTMTLGLPSFGVLASGMMVALAIPDAASGRVAVRPTAKSAAPEHAPAPTISPNANV